jgi:hypothetical protein
MNARMKIEKIIYILFRFAFQNKQRDCLIIEHFPLFNAVPKAS